MASDDGRGSLEDELRRPVAEAEILAFEALARRYRGMDESQPSQPSLAIEQAA